jgi:hypothetical protein
MKSNKSIIQKRLFFEFLFKLFNNSFLIFNKVWFCVLNFVKKAPKINRFIPVYVAIMVIDKKYHN